MAENHVNLKDSVGAIEEMESKMESLWLKRKEEIESELEARIRSEKEEASKKIEAIERELEKGRSVLKDYRTVVTEFETERASLQRQIREHFEKAVENQTEIEKIAGQTMEELRLVNDLNKKLETLNQSAEEKVDGFRRELEERFGIEAELPPSREEEELKVDLDHELRKLRKIKELLESEVSAAEEIAVETVAPPEADIRPVPPVAEVLEKELAEEAGETAAEETSAEQTPAEEKSTQEENGNFKNLFEVLEGYRKIEARNGNGEISFFRKDDKTILDGEYMVASIDESLEEAKRLYLKLSQTESPKEQFFIKQEIINHQEILRKYILRNLKMCEKEGASMPQFTEEILNVDILKEILEKLSIENWSNPAEFNSFRSQIETLKDAYYARITPPAHYLRSLIKDLGA
jgi:DNA repair exonuclease SbcCD ATPase subunit